MTNFTSNPKGILVLVYEDSVSVDLDLRDSISSSDFKNCIVLLRYDNNFIMDNDEPLRKQVNCSLIPDRPQWYRVLRLIHRGAIKYLSGKTSSAYNLLDEIKESLISLEITDLNFSHNFEDDIKLIFNKICDTFEVSPQIKTVLNNLFNEFQKS